MRGIIIAHPNEHFISQLKRALTDCSIPVLYTCDKGSLVLNFAGNMPEAVIVCPVILPDMPAHYLAESLPQSFDVLALAKGADTVSTLSNLCIMSLPLNKNAFVHEALRLCTSASCVSAKCSVKSAEQAALLDEAKKIIMKTKGLSENQAHKYLQRRSMAGGKRMADTAQQIIRLSESRRTP